MPHLNLEYTKNITGLDVPGVLLKLNQALVASGEFQEIDIKSRAIPLEEFLVGTAINGRAFLHAKLAILKGRSTQIKRDLSTRLLLALKEACPKSPGTHTQLCVEILEIDGEVYSKDVIEA